MIERVAQTIAKRRFAVTLWTGVAGLLLFGCFGSGVGVVAAFLSGCSVLGNGSGSSSYDRLPSPAQHSAIRFEPNLGQADPNYRFLAHGKGHSIYLSSAEAVFELRGSRWIGTQSRTIHAELEGALGSVEPDAQEPLSGRVNYLIGNDPHHWHTNIPIFGRVAFHGIYPGVDVVYHGTGGFLENDFIVQPGGDPAAIRIRFTGADEVRLESDGSLALTAGRRTLRWKQPFLYQRGEQGQLNHIEGRFQTPKDGVVGFEVGVYDLHRPLVIDPLLTYATYLGGPNAEAAAHVAADSSGNAYMIGGTDAENFPSTPGVYVSRTLGVLGHVLVAKLTPDGKSLIYETHIGGSGGDTGLGIALDASGNAYLTGMTASADFPVTSNSNLTTKNLTDPLNCFVTKLSPAGDKLVYSTLIGGSKADGCSSVGIDSAGNAYAVGATGSSDFPVLNAIQMSSPSAATGAASAFISKLSPDGSKLLYSTYFGGAGNNAATSVAVDSTGNAYFTGFTTSISFPVTQGAFQTTYGGGGGQNSVLSTLFPTGNFFGYAVTDSLGDGFVVKMSPAGQKMYATYLGGERDDIGFSIAIDSKGDAYVGGATLSSKFPIQSAFQSSYHGAGGNSQASAGDGFIAEIDPTGSQLLFSSYIGGSADDRVMGVALDSSGNIYLAGQSLSKDFPTAGQAVQSTYGGDTNGFFPTGDAFLAEVDTTHKLALSTYLGGSGGDWAGGVAVDGTGGVIIAGGTSSTDFPVSNTGAYQSKYGGSDTQLAGVAVGDAFIARFGGSTTTVSISSISNAASYAGGGVAPGEAVLIQGASIGPAALQTAQLTPSGNISTLVGQTQFTFNGVAAPIVFVSAQASTVIVPYEVANSTSAQVIATYNGGQSAPFTIPVVATLPGIFATNAMGFGQGAIYNQDLTVNSANNAAARGTTVILYVTGEGQTVPAGVDGSVTAVQISPAQQVTVSFGGIPATSYQFVGETPGVVAGVMQINVTIPQLAPTGSAVPITVMVGSATSQSALTIAIQ